MSPIALVEKPVAEINCGVVNNESFVVGEQVLIAAVGRDEAFDLRRT